MILPKLLFIHFLLQNAVLRISDIMITLINFN